MNKGVKIDLPITGIAMTILGVHGTLFEAPFEMPHFIHS
jgi:hypothetical protein